MHCVIRDGRKKVVGRSGGEEGGGEEGWEGWGQERRIRGG